MARPKKRTTEVSDKPSNGFVDALQFLANVTTPVGAPYDTHVYLKNGFATAANGTLSAGIKIVEDLLAAPHNDLMIKALSNCGQNLSITQLDNQRLSIKSDKFKAVIPCVDSSLLQFGMPDNPVGIINDDFKKAVEAINGVPPDTSERVTATSILLNGYSVVATNGSVLFEAWHGLDLPKGIALPKAIIKPLAAINKKLIKFGFSINSFTFWYEDESWFKTQLMAQHWPDVSKILESESNQFPIPGDFFNGLNAVAPFSEDGSIYFQKEKLSSHNTEGVGASFEVAGLPSGPVYPAKQLQLLKGLAETIDFIAPLQGGYCLKFFGKSVRGIIAGRST